MLAHCERSKHESAQCCSFSPKSRFSHFSESITPHVPAGKEGVHGLKPLSTLTTPTLSICSCADLGDTPRAGSASSLLLNKVPCNSPRISPGGPGQLLLQRRRMPLPVTREGQRPSPSTVPKVRPLACFSKHQNERNVLCWSL